MEWIVTIASRENSFNVKYLETTMLDLKVILKHNHGLEICIMNFDALWPLTVVQVSLKFYIKYFANGEKYDDWVNEMWTKPGMKRRASSGTMTFDLQWSWIFADLVEIRE